MDWVKILEKYGLDWIELDWIKKIGPMSNSALDIHILTSEPTHMPKLFKNGTLALPRPHTLTARQIGALKEKFYWPYALPVAQSTVSKH